MRARPVDARGHERAGKPVALQRFQNFLRVGVLHFSAHSRTVSTIARATVRKSSSPIMYGGIV